jgi:hypothetical protein
MTNTNCLEGIKCPACGNEDRFRIAGTTVFTVTDEGTEDHGDIEWDDDSHVECAQCYHHGALRDFSASVPIPGSGPVPTGTRLPARFDGYEVHGVREFDDGDGKFCEQVPDEEAMFWSLYGHIPGLGLECIGDFKTREHAEETYARITGRRYVRSS